MVIMARWLAARFSYRVIRTAPEGCVRITLSINAIALICRVSPAALKGSVQAPPASGRSLLLVGIAGVMLRRRRVERMTPLLYALSAASRSDLHKTGCPWRYPPKDFGSWHTVRTWHDRFRANGIWAEAAAGILLDRAAEDGWDLARIKVDGISVGPRMDAAAQHHGVDGQVSSKPPQSTAFPPLPIRWRIEATFGTQTNLHRRLTRNLEQDPAAAEDAVQIAAFNRVLRACSREVDSPTQSSRP